MPCSEKGSVTRRSATLSTMLTSFFRRSPTFACITCTVGLMGVGSALTCVCVCVWDLSECLFFFDRKTSRTALLFLRSFFFQPLFLLRSCLAVPNVCVCVCVCVCACIATNDVRCLSPISHHTLKNPPKHRTGGGGLVVLGVQKVDKCVPDGLA